MILNRKRKSHCQKLRSDNAKELGKLLNDLRKNSRVKTTLDDAALEFEVSRNTLHAIEKGKALPDMKLLAAASRFYGTDFRQLLALRALAEDDPDLNAQADKLRVVHIQRIVDPRDDLSKVLDIKHLTAVVLAVEGAERRWRRVQMNPSLKAQVIAGLYAVGAREGQFTGLGVNAILDWVRTSFPSDLEPKD